MKQEIASSVDGLDPYIWIGPKPTTDITLSWCRYIYLRRGQFKRKLTVGLNSNSKTTIRANIPRCSLEFVAFIAVFPLFRFIGKSETGPSLTVKCQLYTYYNMQIEFSTQPELRTAFYGSIWSQRERKWKWWWGYIFITVIHQIHLDGWSHDTVRIVISTEFSLPNRLI